MLTYRKTTIKEDETYGLKCNIIKDNQMQCTRRVTRVTVHEPSPNLYNTATDLYLYAADFYWCEGHFQVLLQKAVAAKEDVLDLDAPKENAEGISEPTEKSS